MKVSRVTKICLFLLLIFSAVTLIISKPIYKRLENLVTEYTDYAKTFIKEKTTLDFSYESFSPSILSSFKINGLKFTTQDNIDVLKIEKVNINYSLSALFKKDYNRFFRNVSINGVDVELSKLIKIVQELSEEKRISNGEEKVWKGVESEKIQQIYNFIPINVDVDNVNLIYDDSNVNVIIGIKDVICLNSRRKKTLDVQFDSKTKILIKKTNMIVTGNAFISGNITDNLENSTLYATVTDFTEGRFKLNKINFLGTYSQNNISAHTIQSFNPLYLECNFDILNKIFTANCKSDNFYPNSMYTTTEKKVWDVLENIKLSVFGEIQYEVETKKMDYASNGVVYVSEKLFPGSAAVSYDVIGDRNNINLRSCHVEGPNCNANMNVKFVINQLQAEGVIDLLKYKLPNQNTVSAQIYLEPLKKGFMVFSPQIVLGSKSLTALQCKFIPQTDSIDFEVNASDYLQIENSDPGEIKLNGSYLLKSKYAQTSLTMNTLSLSSVLEYAQEVLPVEKAKSIESIKQKTVDYVFTGDTYFSTDFKMISFNVPYVVVANTKKDNQYLFLSANGNEQSMQLNRFDLILGSYALNLTGSLDINKDTKDMFYSLDLISSSIPYHFSGSYMKEIATLQGDYGLDAQVRFGKNNKIDGYFITQSLPFVYKKLSLFFGIDTKFSYSKQNGPEVTINNFIVEQSDFSSSVNPKLVLSGSGTKYGAQINSITYSDKYSTLDGNADITININENIFDSAGLKFLLKNHSSEESIVIDFSASNPDRLALNSDTIFKNLYLNSQIEINHFGLNRFTNVKNSNNELTSSIYLTGTLEHPYAAITVQNLSVLLGKNLINANCTALLEDRSFIINELNVKYPSWQITNVTGSGNIDNASAKIYGTFETRNTSQTLEIPLILSVYDAIYDDESYLPESFTVTLKSQGMNGSLVKKNVPFEISAIYTKDIISLFSSDNMGLVGTYIPKTGEVFGSINSTDVFSMEIGGTVTSKKINLNFSNINANIKNLTSYFNFDNYFKFDNGIAKGFIQMGGTIDTPDFFVNLLIDNPVFTMPIAFQNQLSTQSIELIALKNEFTLREKTYSLKNVPKFKFGAKVTLDKWSVDTIECNFSTLKDEILPIKFNVPLITVKADITSDLKLLYEDEVWNVSGKVFGDKMNVVIDASNLTKNAIQNNNDIYSTKKNTYVRTDLNVVLGTHVSFNFKPLLQCIFVPNTKMNLKIDSFTQDYEIDGELQLKSGDLAYLNRSFYIKQGKLQFNPTDFRDPFITLKAETREKDENGKTVTIILNVDNQTLSNLNPRFTSIPAKSEIEIMTLLGKIVIADTENFKDVLGTFGDAFVQTTVIRDLENKLRELMNFDIFSIRTNIVQNTINLSTSGMLQNNQVSIGNFLDNSTVYIGKYLGSNLYVDGMFHFSLENGNVNTLSNAGGLLFQPEFGLELELPIANIRWNMAPDINAMMKGEYIPSTSVSLSWSFVF